MRKGERRSGPKFTELWDRGQLDQLIEKSTAYLIEYPNHPGALCYGAKALVAKKEHLSEARARLTMLIELEPTLKASIQEDIDAIDQIERS